MRLHRFRAFGASLTMTLLALGCSTPQPGALAAAPATAAPLAAPVPLVETLDNGLTIVVLEHHAAPVVTVQGWVNAGSTTEGAQTGAGLSHFLEHMLFKGTERRSVGQMGRDVKAIGGYTNAYTSFDRTVYYINCDAGAVTDALDILTDVLNNATFEPAEIEKEREVIVREMNMSRDDPAGWAGRLLFQEAFMRHPYRHPVIGYESQLRAITRDDLVAYYHRLYVPNNMALIIVGDVDAPATMAEVKRLWADVPRQGLAVPFRPTEPRQFGPRERIEERDARLAYVYLGYHGPALADPDLFPMDVLSLILGGGATSRLHRTVREELELVHSIGTFSYTPRDPGIFGVSFTAEPEQRDAATAATLAEIARLQRDGVSARELAIAKRKVMANHVFNHETAGQRADGLGTGLILAGDLEFDTRYVAGIQAVTAEDVRRVARLYLTEENRTTSAVLPRGTLKDRAEAAALPSSEAMEIRTLDNGVRVILRQNPATPMIALRAVGLGGLRSESADQIGISYLMSRVLPKGTARWSAAELAEVVESRGGASGAFSGSNSWGANVTMLADDWTVACDVLEQLLLAPTFPEAEVERERATVLAQIRAQDEDVSTVASRLARQQLYAAHPYRWMEEGSAEAVARITAADLRAHHARLLDPARLVIAAAGALDTDALLAQLNASFGRIPPQPAPWPAPAPPEFADHAGRVVTDARDSAQTIIMVAFPGVTADDPREDVLSVMQTALNSQGGRLFQTLRDEEGLAYAVGFWSRPGLERGMLTFYIATVAQQRDAALAGLWREIDGVREGGLTAEEITDARRVIISQQAQHMEQNSSFAFATALDELYGLGAAHYQTLPARLDTVTPETTRAVAAALFDRQKAVVIDVGPQPAD